MRKLFKIKRLKIAEQILVVLLGAVLVPMIISGFIINNINQQSVRQQLRSSATLITNLVSDEIDLFIEVSGNELSQIALLLDYFPGDAQKNAILNKIVSKSSHFMELEYVDTYEEYKSIYKDGRMNDRIVLKTQTLDGKYVVATYNINNLKKQLFKSLQEDKRQIYVLDYNRQLIASHNYTKETFEETMKLLPEELVLDSAKIFGDVKNQPLVYLKKSKPNIIIVLNTTENIARVAIYDNRIKIILSILLASLSIFFVVGLYIYYLYINIRQLFKGIIALSKGNYERRIRLLTNVFTPYEIIFLAFEFNRMANQIHKSYIQLRRNNEELEKLNEFRSNLIDTVSHEFRTPLTSIQGYTSRLLRQDIQIDEKTRQKSLHIIKKQSERLKRMVEDLLVIPDIEGSRIHAKIEPIYLPEIIENAMIILKNEEQKNIVSNVCEDFPLMLADKDRIEQVLVNLLENALKYSYDDSSIIIEGDFDDDYAKIYVKNKCDVIPPDKLHRLFEKFTRIDDKTTRTTRGTGLGLFIVKGLVEVMNGNITLDSNEEYGFCVKIQFPIFKPEEAKVLL